MIFTITLQSTIEKNKKVSHLTIHNKLVSTQVKPLEGKRSKYLFIQINKSSINYLKSNMLILLIKITNKTYQNIETQPQTLAQFIKRRRLIMHL